MRAMKRIIVEIAVHSVESAIAAQAGGADRMELFTNPVEGGVTPSEGLIATVRERLLKDLHVMIRPRGGDFHYSDLEFEVMLRDVNVVRRLGANGVVLGLVNVDGTVDMRRTRQIVEACRPLSVTFHRALDVCVNLEKALEDLITCGVDRVLTSGGEASAVEGSKSIANLVRLAGNRIRIMAGGGIRPENIRQIVRETGVRELHAGLRSTIPGPMRFHSDKVSFGHKVPGQYERTIIREEDVRRLVREAELL